ncbi:UNVERIFIED_CONTAM: hypothetical protein H355_009822 [Colinus virginianus]|nr:hypothetical protein H355_009822 [Colinus virginianus]
MGSHEKDPSSPKKALSRSNSTVSSKHSSVQQGSESWEVVEEPRARGSPDREPERQEGYLLKKRKWPLKGWHKRYFVLENGILKYATTRQEVLKGKLHGAIDIRQSVMSVNKKAQRVDLDTEENIYHLKGPWTRIMPSGSAPALSALTSSRDKVDAWLKDSEGLERCSAELSACQAQLRELTEMLQSLESLHRIPSAPLISSTQPSAAAERPKKGRRTTRMWCTQSFAKDDTIGRVGRLHGSVPNLSRYLEPSQGPLPFSLPPEYSQLQRSFWVLAQKVHGSLSSVVTVLTAERARLEDMQRALDRRRSAPRPGSAGPTGTPLPGLEPRDGLQRFHSLSVSSDTTMDSFASLLPDEPDMLPAKGREQQRSQRSIASLADSHTEFFDACEVFLSASSSENEASDDESCISEATNSIDEDPAEPGGGPAHPQTGMDSLGGLVELPGPGPQRRSRLPAPPAPPGDVSLWGLLRSSVGKDLSRVALPVQLNEPLNTLQRLCEELEYSALLDRAARARDPRQRLVGDVLGGRGLVGTWVRDIGWRDVGPLLTALPPPNLSPSVYRSGDHFEWNKVTTCIHNVLSGPRWIEHYGEVLIRNTRDASYHCKITFCKARYWGAGANEVQGAVLSRSGAVVERLAGKWHEGLFRGPAPGQCIWRANPMPPDHERNYGFTQFALELNELTPELRRALPSTDTRLRPDQRYLEEGNVAAAEAQKRQIEQLQRDRRRVMEENNIAHQARFFRRLMDASGKESWVTNNTYWKLRVDPGFAHLDSAVLW